MEPIPGIELGKLDEQATTAYRKIVQARISDHFRGLLVQAHNLQMKGDRLRREAEQADAQLAVCNKAIERIRSGDWSAIDPFEISDKQ